MERETLSNRLRTAYWSLVALGCGLMLCKRQLQQRSRQKGTATQERWLFPFSCKRKVVYAMGQSQILCKLHLGCE